MNKMSSISITGDNTLRVLMMKSTMAIMSLAFLSGIAHAASTTKNWTGLYGGVNAGGIYNTAYLDANNLGFTRANGTCDTSTHFSSFFPGVQIGYSRQFNTKVVVGVEGDFTYNSNQQVNTACTCDVTPVFPISLLSRIGSKAPCVVELVMRLIIIYFPFLWRVEA